ncbi:MAG: amino acid adenylation domain-containing protein, partial [Acidobacteriota bacterium]|nr:amino acid adenylation domain-containing protein [Acidobacteriota bacterium]
MSGDVHDPQAERRRLIRERLRKAREGRGGRTGIPTRDRGQAVPLTSAQERLWFLERLMPDTGLFNICRAFSLGGALEPRALARALGALLRRHRVLCTAFVEAQEGARQESRPVPAASELLPVVDLSALPEAVAEQLCDGHLQTLATRPFDLSRPPLLRTLLLRLGPWDHRWGLAVHHLVFDGWSLAILQKELGTLYAGELNASRLSSSKSADPELEYADYAVWERRRLEEEPPTADLEFWRRRLEGLTPLELPADRPRPPVRTLAAEQLPVRLSPALRQALEARGRAAGTSLFMMLAAGWAAVLSRWSGQRDLAVGVPVAGRDRKEVEGLIGFFVNTVVLRYQLSATPGGDPSLNQLLEAAKKHTLEAMSHARVPFARVVQEVAPDRGRSHAPLYQVTLALQNAPAARLELEGLEPAAGEVVDRGLTEQDLILSLEPEGGSGDANLGRANLERTGLAGAVLFSTELFDRSTVRRWVGHLRRMLEALAYDPGQRLSEVELTGPAERQQLLWDWSHAGGSARAGLTGLKSSAGLASSGRETVLPAVLRWAESHPDLPAVLSDTDSPLTYGELEESSRRWAHWLRERWLLERNGAEEPIVALCLERSTELVVSALAVLRSGGAYLPLDPAHPPERLAWMAEDAGAARVFVGREADEELIEAFRAAGVETVVAGAEPPAAADGGLGDGALPTPRAADAAYVIYTSGSTGQPKGTLLTHGGLANLVAWHGSLHGEPSADGWGRRPGVRTTLLAGPGFDASVWELWSSLALGATLVPVPSAVVSQPPELIRFLHQRQVRQTFLPTPLAEVVMEELDAGLARQQDLPSPEDWSVEMLFVGGDRLHRGPSLADGTDRAAYQMMDLYGPTEATVISVASRVAEPGSGVEHAIGRPLPGVRSYVVDEALQPVPAGVAGELVLGGVGLARGYLGRPARTAQAFVPDPLGGREGERLYRTGDLARFRADGRVDFLGRRDHQVK